MPEHLIGAVVERAPSFRYFDALSFAEIAPRKPLPRPAVLGRWRAGAPENARFALHAPADTWRSASGPFREDPKKSEGAEWMVRAHDALAADALVLVTGADLTPGPRDRERVASWIDFLAGKGRRRIVWQPGGLWDAEEAAAFAASLGAVCGFDPLESPAPPGEIAYARVRAIGARSRLGEGLLSAIVDAVAGSDAATVYLAIESEQGVKKARRALELLSSLGDGGGSAVLRRTGGVVVDLGDDEDLDEDELDGEGEDLDEGQDDEDLDEGQDDEDLDEDEDDEDLDEDEDEDDEDDEDE